MGGASGMGCLQVEARLVAMSATAVERIGRRTGDHIESDRKEAPVAMVHRLVTHFLRQFFGISLMVSTWRLNAWTLAVASPNRGLITPPSGVGMAGCAAVFMYC